MAKLELSQPDLLRLLPYFMREEADVQFLAQQADLDFGNLAKRIPVFSFWAYLDQLTGAELDDIAWEIDIDWYDSSASIESKRQQIMNAILIKAHRGTPWAVERLLYAYFGSGWIEEWFQYGGAEYTFRAFVDHVVTQENLNKFFYAIETSKNVRSHFDGFFYYRKTPLPDLELIYQPKKSRSGAMKHWKCGVAFRRAFAGFNPSQDIAFIGESQSGSIRHRKVGEKIRPNVKAFFPSPVDVAVSSEFGSILHTKVGEPFGTNPAAASSLIGLTAKGIPGNKPEPDYENLESGQFPREKTAGFNPKRFALKLVYSNRQGKRIEPWTVENFLTSTKRISMELKGRSQKGIITRGGELVRVL